MRSEVSEESNRRRTLHLGTGQCQCSAAQGFTPALCAVVNQRRLVGIHSLSLPASTAIADEPANAAYITTRRQIRNVAAGSWSMSCTSAFAWPIHTIVSADLGRLRRDKDLQCAWEQEQQTTHERMM